MTERAPVRWSEPERRKHFWLIVGDEGEIIIDLWHNGKVSANAGAGYTLRDCLEGEDLLRKAAQK